MLKTADRHARCFLVLTYEAIWCTGSDKVNDFGTNFCWSLHGLAVLCLCLYTATCSHNNNTNTAFSLTKFWSHLIKNCFSVRWIRGKPLNTTIPRSICCSCCSAKWLINEGEEEDGVNEWRRWRKWGERKQRGKVSCPSVQSDRAPSTVGGWGVGGLLSASWVRHEGVH